MQSSTEKRLSKGGRRKGRDPEFLPTSQNFGSGGGTGSLNVTSATGCAWTATTNDAWIVITSGSSGTGNGTVNYSVAANSGSARLGTITIAGQTFTVTQDGVSTGLFQITQWVIAGGGGRSTGGTYSLDGTIGQGLAGTESTGVNFSLLSGFWAASDVTLASVARFLPLAATSSLTRWFTDHHHGQQGDEARWRIGSAPP